MNFELPIGPQTMNALIARQLLALLFLAAALIIGITSDITAATNESSLHLLNISARGRVETGGDVLIGGFIVTGTGSKTVVVRSLGPSLNVNGVAVPGRLGDPTLELYAQGSNVPIAINDNWRSTQQTQLIATGLQPSNDLEAAIVTTLNPGAYTTVVRGKNNSVGIALVEIFDATNTDDPKLANVSARGLVQSGNNVIIGGFIAGGDAHAGAMISVVIRAIGPSLSNHGIPNPLLDPTLELFDANGFRLANNDDWREGNSLDFQRSPLAPSDDREAAIPTILPAGAYTAIVRGKDGATGTALIEIYDAPIPTF